MNALKEEQQQRSGKALKEGATCAPWSWLSQLCPALKERENARECLAGANSKGAGECSQLIAVKNQLFSSQLIAGLTF